MNFLFLLYVIFCVCLTSCSEAPQPLNPMQEIQGRDYDGTRFNVYRARAPHEWIRKDSFKEESLTDTKKSICDFFIHNDKGIIRIAIHNFPSNSVDERIPPAAQIARWQRQFDFLQAEESNTIQQAFNGYTGLKFKGVGVIEQKDTMMLGWTLQLGKEHYQMLSHPRNSADHNLYREMRADVTIKVTGPTELMENHEDDIIAFARSFELIREIPSRL